MLSLNEAGPSQRGGATEAQSQSFLIPQPKNTTIAQLHAPRRNQADSSGDAGGLLAQWKLLAMASCDPDTTKADVAILIAIFDRFGRTGIAWPSLDTISRESATTRSTVVRSIARLVDLGYLIRASGDRTNANRYRAGAPRLAAAPRRTRAPTSGSREPRSASASMVGAAPLGEVGAPPHLELASQSNLPREKAKAPPSERAKSRAGTADRFADFWSAYPRREGDKQKALATWRKKHLDAIADSIIAHVRERGAGDPQWLKDGGQFVPFATTFLNGERWTDEWQASAAQHRAAASPTRVTRSTLSDEEVDLESARALARLNPKHQIGGAP